ncbi:MAG: 3-dehydro-L-gulonate 2-dehydrogenase [Janthinobacterium lividum]
MIRIPVDELQSRIERILLSLGLAPARAAKGARLIAETDRDGVRTHGIARLPRFAQMVRLGRIVPGAEPERVAGLGALERWTGHRGPGNLAAQAMTARAVELAKTHGVGAVALGDTTHWQRGGSYGWQAAEAGCALLAWTNTMPNLPPWGATSPALGNNPLVIVVPGSGSTAPVVLDIAMSQFSYGALASYAARGEQLPVAGGFDAAGELSQDPAAIEGTQRAVPIGFWKGSGLAFVLDLLAAMLAGGRATHEIEPDPLQEVGISQVFLAVRPEAVSSLGEMERVLQGCIDSLHAATPVVPGTLPRFPGEGTGRVREESLRLGVGVEEGVWAAFQALEREGTAENA